VKRPFLLSLKALIDFLLIRDDLDKHPHLKGDLSFADAFTMMMAVVVLSVALATWGFMVWGKFTIAGFFLYLVFVIYCTAQATHILERRKI